MDNLFFENKEGKKVFITQDRGFFYELSNEVPKPGDYVLVDLEHDPTHVVKVESFDKNAYYPINNGKGPRFGAIPLGYVSGMGIRFYGCGKIEWTDNPNLQKFFEESRLERFNYWGQKNPQLTIEDF